jgi:hypothetical protein
MTHAQNRIISVIQSQSQEVPQFPYMWCMSSGFTNRAHDASAISPIALTALQLVD